MESHGRRGREGTSERFKLRLSIEPCSWWRKLGELAKTRCLLGYLNLKQAVTKPRPGPPQAWNSHGDNAGQLPGPSRSCSPPAPATRRWGSACHEKTSQSDVNQPSRPGVRRRGGRCGSHCRWRLQHEPPAATPPHATHRHFVQCLCKSLACWWTVTASPRLFCSSHPADR